LLASCPANERCRFRRLFLYTVEIQVGLVIMAGGVSRILRIHVQLSQGEGKAEAIVAAPRSSQLSPLRPSFQISAYLHMLEPMIRSSSFFMIKTNQPLRLRSRERLRVNSRKH